MFNLIRVFTSEGLAFSFPAELLFSAENRKAVPTKKKKKKILVASSLCFPVFCSISNALQISIHSNSFLYEEQQQTRKNFWDKNADVGSRVLLLLKSNLFVAVNVHVVRFLF